MLVVKFHVNSFIATLGMSQVLAAATLWISKNRQIVGVFSRALPRVRSSRPLRAADRRLLPPRHRPRHLVRHRVHAARTPPAGHRRQPRGGPPRRRAHRSHGVGLARRVGSRRRPGRHHLRRQGRFVLQHVRAAAALPRLRRRLLRLHPVQEPGQRVGHHRRRLHAGVRRQGPAARVQRRRVLDHAAVQRPRPARRRRPRQPQGHPAAAAEGGRRRRGGSRGARPTHLEPALDQPPRSTIGTPGGNP